MVCVTAAAAAVFDDVADDEAVTRTVDVTSRAALHSAAAVVGWRQPVAAASSTKKCSNIVGRPGAAVMGRCDADVFLLLLLLWLLLLLGDRGPFLAWTSPLLSSMREREEKQRASQRLDKKRQRTSFIVHPFGDHV